MDTRVADELIGALVDGRYRVRSRVASGGMATVYTAVDERLERTIALKIIHPAQATDPRFVDRFIREAKTIARLTHPNVVAVYDQGTHQGLPYLVMEYVRGRTLRDMLADERRVAPGDALAILEPMLAAIAAAHRGGVIHRDVKPENVLVAASPGGTGLLDAVVKVADFGLARAVEASAEDGDGQLLATVAYVAPELVSDGRADPRTDVYSVGIVAFEMLTGRVPYDGAKPIDVAWAHVDQDVPPPSKYVPNLPPEIDALVVRATRRDPARRPSDAGAMLAEVQAAREAMEAQGSLTARTVVQPTLPADQTRPTWARLPDGSAERRPGETGRRRAGAAVATRPGVHPAIAWFQGVMARPNGRRTFYATLAALALLVAVGGWWFGAGRFTSTPTLTGQTKAAAVAAASKAGLKIHFADPQWNEKIPKDTVVTQTPAPGADIVHGGTVTVVLSKGPERYPVPDDVGKPFTQVQADLTAIKMVAKKVDAYDDQLPAGVVLSLDPAAGTVLPPGATVTVKVSKGKAPITVPKVTGLDFNTANQQLTQLGLVVAQTPAQSDQPAGTVLKQSIAPGTGTTKGATIVLTVSSGPPLVTIPDLTNQGIGYDQAVQTLQGLGLTVVPVVNVPGGQVRQMNPGPNQQVPRGTQIQLWVW